MRLWKLWARTIGDKISENDREADLAAIYRTFWHLLHIVTCFFIIANCIRHW